MKNIAKKLACIKPRFEDIFEQFDRYRNNLCNKTVIRLIAVVVVYERIVKFVNSAVAFGNYSLIETVYEFARKVCEVYLSSCKSRNCHNNLKKTNWRWTSRHLDISQHGIQAIFGGTMLLPSFLSYEPRGRGNFQSMYFACCCDFPTICRQYWYTCYSLQLLPLCLYVIFVRTPVRCVPFHTLRNGLHIVLMFNPYCFRLRHEWRTCKYLLLSFEFSAEL